MTETAKLEQLISARAAAYAQLVAMPAALINSSLSGRADPPEVALTLSFLAVVVGFGIAGFAAGVNATRDVAKYGAVAALVSFVPVEMIAILGRMDRGDPIRLLGIVMHGAVAAGIGLLTVKLGQRRQQANLNRNDVSVTSPLEGQQ